MPLWRTYREHDCRRFIFDASQENNWPIFEKHIRQFLQATPAKRYSGILDWHWDGKQWADKSGKKVLWPKRDGKGGAL